MNKPFSFSVAPLSRLVFARRVPVLEKDLQKLYVEFAPEGSFEQDVTSFCFEEDSLSVGDALERDFTSQETRHEPSLLRLYAIRLAYAKLVQSDALFTAGRALEAWDALIDAHFWHGSAVTLGPLEVLAASMHAESRSTLGMSGADGRSETYSGQKVEAEAIFLSYARALEQGARFSNKTHLARLVAGKLKDAGHKPVTLKRLVTWMIGWAQLHELDVF